VYKEIFDVNLKGSKTDLNMGLIKPSYKIITPEVIGDFSFQLENCLHQLKAIVEKGELSPIRVNFFVKSENQADYLSQHDQVDALFQKTFGINCPPFGAVMQEPEDPFLIIAEVGFVKNTDAKVVYGSFRKRSYCIVDTKNYKEYWTIGAQAVHPDFNILASSNSAFSYLLDLYKHLGLSFNNIVRQWNYVGEILSKETIADRERQHYQMFNETRSKYYGSYRTIKDFPAATGIGMLYLGVCIDSFAVSGDENLKVIPISSPVQRESYCYGQNVLIGAPDQKMKQNQPPQFERAKLIALNNASRLIISGTASIIGEETIGIGDVEEQTRVTIENIQQLSSPENIRKQCPELNEIPLKYSYIRVYIKYKEDFQKVKNICKQTYGDTPATYVVADICRDNLLVEIEAELVSS